MFRCKLFRSIYQVLEFILNEYSNKEIYFIFNKDIILNYKDINSLVYLIDYNNKLNEINLEELINHLEEEKVELVKILDDIENKTKVNKFDLIHVFEEMCDCIFIMSSILTINKDRFFELENINEVFFKAFNIISETDNDFKGSNILEPILRMFYFKSIEIYYSKLIINTVTKYENESDEFIINKLRVINFYTFVDIHDLYNKIIEKRSRSEIIKNPKIRKEIRTLVRDRIELK